MIEEQREFKRWEEGEVSCPCLGNDGGPWVKGMSREAQCEADKTPVFALCYWNTSSKTGYCDIYTPR